MSETAPEARPGGAARRPVLGVPLWGWGIIAGAGLGAIWLLRRARGGSSSGTAAAVQVPSDQQIGLTEYEQISAQLTGIEGTDQALLAAIKDLQGADSTAPGGGGGGGNDARQDEAEQDQDQAQAAAAEESGESPGQERRENRARRRTVPPSNRRVITGGRAPATTPAPAQTPGPAARRRRRARPRRAAA